MKRFPLHWGASVLVLSAGLLLSCCGCTSTRPPSPNEVRQIVAAIKSYETNVTASAHGHLPAGLLSEDAPIDIRVKNRVAVARYTASGTGQLAFVPVKSVLEHVSYDQWTVLSQETTWPWWWHVLNMTVGVK